MCPSQAGKRATQILDFHESKSNWEITKCYHVELTGYACSILFHQLYSFLLCVTFSPVSAPCSVLTVTQRLRKTHWQQTASLTDMGVYILPASRVDKKKHQMQFKHQGITVIWLMLYDTGYSMQHVCCFFSSSLPLLSSLELPDVGNYIYIF